MNSTFRESHAAIAVALAATDALFDGSSGTPINGATDTMMTIQNTGANNLNLTWSEGTQGGPLIAVTAVGAAVNPIVAGTNVIIHVTDMSAKRIRVQLTALVGVTTATVDIEGVHIS